MINTTVDVGAHNRCVRDCDPRKAHLRNRAIEIAHSSPNAVCAVEGDVQVDPNTVAAGCVFDSLKARFSVYSGAFPSVRDMTFTWQVLGGFIPYQLNLANNQTGSSIMPRSMAPAPNLNALFVVDGVSGGVFELVLDPFVVNGNPYL
jgi:hypothetical protein